LVTDFTVGNDSGSLVAWRSGNAMCQINKLLNGDPVSTWMGDCLRAGKQSRYEASQLGRLSLLPSVGW